MSRTAGAAWAHEVSEYLAAVRRAETNGMRSEAGRMRGRPGAMARVRRGVAVATAGAAVRPGGSASVAAPLAVSRLQPAESPGRTSPVRIGAPLHDRVLLGKRLIRPRWEGLDLQPYVPVEPAPRLTEPLRVGDFLLWVDAPGARAFFTLAVPRLLDFSLTIQKEVRDDTIKITGGTGVLVVGAYDVSDAAASVLREQLWTDALAAGGFGTRAWRFQPLNLRNLEAILQVDPRHLSRPTQVTASGELGTATFVVELSELGAQIWKDAFDTGQVTTLPGVCTLNARYYAQLEQGVEVKEQAVSASLGALLEGVGPDAVHVLNPQISFEARVIVAGHPTLEGVVVNWSPSEGQAPQSLVFDETGGQFSALLTSQNIGAIAIDWSAQVRFKPAGWPDIAQSGKLSVSSGHWSLVLKPGSWLTTYTISAVLLDGAGEVIADADFSDPESLIQAELTFTAPFLKGNVLKSTLFEAENQHAVTVAFPNPPGEAPGKVRLTIFATRGGKLRAKKRVLQRDESLVAITISPDAQIEIITSNDATPERSAPAEILRRLALLK